MNCIRRMRLGHSSWPNLSFYHDTPFNPFSRDAPFNIFFLVHWAEKIELYNGFTAMNNIDILRAAGICNLESFLHDAVNISASLAARTVNPTKHIIHNGIPIKIAEKNDIKFIVASEETWKRITAKSAYQSIFYLTEHDLTTYRLIHTADKSPVLVGGIVTSVGDIGIFSDGSIRAGTDIVSAVNSVPPLIIEEYFNRKIHTTKRVVRITYGDYTDEIDLEKFVLYSSATPQSAIKLDIPYRASVHKSYIAIFNGEYPHLVYEDIATYITAMKLLGIHVMPHGHPNMQWRTFFEKSSK